VKTSHGKIETERRPYLDQHGEVKRQAALNLDRGQAKQVREYRCLTVKLRGPRPYPQSHALRL